MKDNDLTVTLVDCRWVPCYHARVLQQDFGLMDDGKITISTGTRNREEAEGRQSVTTYSVS